MPIFGGSFISQMTNIVLIVLIVGAGGASSSAFAGDLELIQTWSRAASSLATPPDVPFYVRPGIAHAASTTRQWMLLLESDATDEELGNFSNEFPNGQRGHPDRGEAPFVMGGLSEDGVRALVAKHPGRVRFVEEDAFEHKVPDSETINANLSGQRRTYPWGIDFLNAQDRGRGAGVSVYVLDTGVRITHDEFGGRAFAGVDLTNPAHYPGTVTVCSPSSTTCADDQHGHGSHCAGTVGASTYGVADGATIWAMKVLMNNGAGWTTWAILAEQWILTNGSRPAVASISIQANFNSYAEQESIDSLVADGVTVVVAAGNYNQDASAWSGVDPVGDHRGIFWWTRRRFRKYVGQVFIQQLGL
jgi:hypothetical protein